MIGAEITSPVVNFVFHFNTPLAETAFEAAVPAKLPFAFGQADFASPLDARTTIFAGYEFLFSVAVTVAGPLHVAMVAIVNAAVIARAATLTDAGILTTPLLLLREIVIPPVGAGPVRVTVPFAEVPATKLVGFTVSFTFGAKTVRTALTVLDSAEAESVVTWSSATAEVGIETTTLLAPAGTVPVAGSRTAASVSAREKV